MESLFQVFKSSLSDKSIQIRNIYLDNVVRTFNYHVFINVNDYSTIDDILQKASDIIFISEYIEKSQRCQFDTDFFIICYEKTLIFVQQTEIKQFKNIFTKNHESTIYFQSKNVQYKIEQLINIQFNFKKVKEKSFSIQELDSFNREFQLQIKNFAEKTKIIDLFSIIRESISSYLLTKAYNKSISYDRVLHYNDYLKKNEEKTLNNNEYIILRDLGNMNNVCLMYHIELEQLFVLKIFLDENVEKLFERERLNYQRIKHPFFPKYYGTAQYHSYKAIVIEYIPGKSMDKIDEMKLSTKNKIKIIFQLMIGIEYLHQKGFIYRDLKPDNVFIINEKDSISIIDFDRMIEDNLKYNFTKDFFINEFIAPELLTDNIFTNKVDIYSIGKIINYIFSDEILTDSHYREIVKKCTMKNDKERPNISQLINEFYIKFIAEKSEINETDIIINTKYIHSELYNNFWFFISENNHPNAQYNLGLLHKSGKLKSDKSFNKSIQYFTHAANQNNAGAQFQLGLIYDDERFIKHDINKSIYYYTLAANQNMKEAQFNLGLIYKEDKYISRDINKSIYYYTLAANQNFKKAQYNLGILYKEGKYITRDIIKSIYYFTLAANQNEANAQFQLGLIYDEGEFIERDISKSIYYYTLAANQNLKDAQFNLGLLYQEDKYITRDINKSIYYFTLAANQNHIAAQYSLGLIFYKGQFIKRDINKSIYYFSLAANQNNVNSQFNLGLIYEKGKFVKRDINKSIYYYTLAANQNLKDAQSNLGLIYSDGKYIPRDIKKSIFFLTLASKHNDKKSQHNLGMIYLYTKDISKSIYYLTLASNQNEIKAQFVLGMIYLKNEYGCQNINKAIYYLTLAANQNSSYAQCMLGAIYQQNEYVPKNINKSFQYYLRAANNNHPYALLKIGLFYLEGNHFTKNIKKAISYLTLAVENHCIQANYYLGCIYFKGIGVDKDIDKSIQYFKEGSSFNDNYCKNNLGIIYKNIKKNEVAIEYFEEAIRQKNDYVAMYNLGSIYFFGEFVKSDIDKSIELFIKSANGKFNQSLILLSFAIVKKLPNLINVENISFELEKHGNKSLELTQIILDIIYEFDLETNYQIQISNFEKDEFIYDINHDYINYWEYTANELEQNNEKNQKIDLTQDFYDGFGIY